MCDERVPIETKICPSCSTDLSLFSPDDSLGDAVDAEELKKSLLSSDNGHLTELFEAADNDSSNPPPPQPVPLVYDDSVECPACGKSIPGDANKCPHCGVEFEVEEVFECPMCKALVDIHVNKCPSCGAEFEEDTSAPLPETPPPAAPEPPKVEPKPEPKPVPQTGPVSFADRLKQIKDEPSGTTPATSEPKKEMTFAERMKAMKNEPTPGETPTPSPPTPVTQVTPAPKPAVQEQKEPPQPQERKEGNIADRMKSLKEGIPASKPQPAATQTHPTPQKPESGQQVTHSQEGYKELPHYIGEVKKLLILANELKIDVSTSKALINKAVTAGKTRDLDNAIRLVKEGMSGLERDIRANLLQKTRTLDMALSIDRKSGRDVTALEHSIAEIKKSMEVNDFQIAYGEIKKVETQISSSPTATMSQVELEVIERALSDADYLNLNVSEAKSLYQSALKAIESNDGKNSTLMSKQAMDILNRQLPSFIASEMRKAKVTLREIKMMNVDITSPVNQLKEANDYVLQGDYCAALGAIRKFREFVDKAQG